MHWQYMTQTIPKYLKLWVDCPEVHCFQIAQLLSLEQLTKGHSAIDFLFSLHHPESKQQVN